MGFFSQLFKNKKHLITDNDFDERYKIVVIRGFNDNTPYICEINDFRYTSVLFHFPEDYTEKDIQIYKFSTGVKELCVKNLCSLLFYEDYKFNRDDFINYLKNAGCPDIVVDGFIDCTGKDINKSKMPKSKYIKIYDFDGNFIGCKLKDQDFKS